MKEIKPFVLEARQKSGSQVIYTTSAIEPVNMSVGKISRILYRGSFQSDEALMDDAPSGSGKLR